MFLVNYKMTSKKDLMLLNLLNEASLERMMIGNDHNGKHKLGCIIFDNRVNRQYVLQFWV